MLSDLLSCVRINVLRGFQENSTDVGCAFFLGLWFHGPCKASNRNPGGAVHMYLTISIAECLHLLIGNTWVDRVLVFGVSGARLCGLVFLVLRGSLAGAARRIGSCIIAQFMLVGHGLVGIDHFADGRGARVDRHAGGGLW